MRWLILILSLISLAAAPKAVVKAPPSVQAGSFVRFDITGTVSDPPCELFLISSPDAGEQLFHRDGKLAAYCLTKPGQYLFVLVAYGRDSSPVTASAVVQVIPAGPASPASDALSSGARIYIQAIPDDFTQAGADLRTGKLKTVAEVNKAIADYRRSGGQALAAEMNRRFAAGSDAGGTITDPSGIASALEAIGDSQREVLKP